MAKNPWTTCSCGHLAQDHNAELKCEHTGCKCVKYDGKKIEEMKD